MWSVLNTEFQENKKIPKLRHFSELCNSANRARAKPLNMMRLERKRSQWQLMAAYHNVISKLGTLKVLFTLLSNEPKILCRNMNKLSMRAVLLQSKPELLKYK